MALAFVVGSAALIGWILHVHPLTTVGLGTEAVKRSTSICLLLLGVSIAFSRIEDEPRPGRFWVAVPAAIAATVASVTLIEYGSPGTFRIGEATFRALGLGRLPSELMAPNTAVAILLLGGSLASSVYARSHRRWREWTQWLSLTSGFVALLAIVGYVYGAATFVGIGGYTAMAPPTALAIFGLSVGALILRDDYHARRILVSRGPGGTLARRLVPAVFLLPITLGWIRIQLQLRFAIIQTREGVALLVVLFILFFFAMIWVTSRRLDASAATLRRAYAELEDRIRERTAELQASERRFRILFEKGQGLICIHDLQGKLLMVNAAAANALGYEPAEMDGRDLAEFVHPDVRARMPAYLEEARSGQNVTGHMRTLAKGGESRIWAYHNSLHVDAEGHRYVIGHATDVTDAVQTRNRLARDNRSLADLAMTDPLTGLPNRRLFDDRLSVALSAARREGHRMALVFIDLDRFKEINDTLGHAAGDFLLKSVAGRVAGIVRSSDTLARIGGDEFILLLANVDRRENAEVVTLKIREQVARPLDVGGKEIRVGVSIGLSVFPEDGDTPESLVRSADAAMYAMKQRSRTPEPPSDDQ